MKMNLTKIITGKICLVALLMSFGIKSYGAAHLTMTIENCVTTNNEIKFDFMLQNDGDQPMKFNSAAFRLIHNSALIPSGAKNFTFSYVDGSSDFSSALNSRNGNYNMNYNPENQLMQFTTSTSNYTSANAISIPAGGKAMRVGTFSLKIVGGEWISGTEVNTSFFPSGNGAVVYNNGSNITTSMSQTWAIADGESKSTNVRDAYTIKNNSVARTTSVPFAVTGNYAGAPFSPSSLTINVKSTCRIAGEKIKNIATASGYSAYPNPTSGKVTIEFTADRDAKYSLKVFDILGSVIMKNDISAIEGFNSKNLNLETVAKGMYFVSLQTEGSDALTLPLVVE